MSGLGFVEQRARTPSRTYTCDGMSHRGRSDRRARVGLAWLLVIAVLGACDPGGSYSVPGVTMLMVNGREFDIVGNSSTSLRAHASWFTSSLDIGLTITNKGSTPLAIRPNEFRVADRKGALEPKYGSRAPRCTGHETEELVTLAPGDTCQMFAGFEVVADRDRLRTITLTHDGVTRAGIAVPVSVKFEMDAR